MKTCKDCYHQKACQSMFEAQGYSVSENYIGDATRCDTFKDKSLVLDLPCKVGDTVWTKYGYTFEIEKIEILKDKKIFRCGNHGTDDYMAFFEDEIGIEVFLTREEAAEQALKGGAE